MSFVLVVLMIGLAANMVNAAPMPGGVYIGYVYVNGVEVGDFTVGVSFGPTYYWTEYYPPGDPIGTYEMDITIPDEGSTTGSIVCTVPGVGTQTLDNVDLTQDYVGCNWYFTNASPPAANFSAEVLSGIAPLTVQFMDTSVNASSLQWDFGDGTPNSTLQNPAHEYTAPGTYTVSLTATNAAGSNEAIRAGYIVVSAPMPNSSYIDNSIPDEMNAGQTYTESITFRNTGNTPWSPASGDKLAVFGQTWAYSMNNTTAVSGTPTFTIPEGVTVNPGQTYTWNIQMTPLWQGSYQLGFQVVEGNSWLGDYGTKTSSILPETSYVSNTIPDTMVSNNQYMATITFRNIGNTPWSSANGYEMVMWGQTWAFDLNNTATAYGIPAFTMPEGVTVNPGQTYTWNIQMTPLWQGSYGLGFQVVNVNQDVWIPGSGDKSVTVT